MSRQPPKRLDQVRQPMRRKHDALRTEQHTTIVASQSFSTKPFPPKKKVIPNLVILAAIVVQETFLFWTIGCRAKYGLTSPGFSVQKLRSPIYVKKVVAWITFLSLDHHGQAIRRSGVR